MVLPKTFSLHSSFSARVCGSGRHPLPDRFRRHFKDCFRCRVVKEAGDYFQATRKILQVSEARESICTKLGTLPRIEA
jgi:hypothetical protein